MNSVSSLLGFQHRQLSMDIELLTAFSIHLEVDSTPGEHSDRTRGDVIENKTGAILSKHSGAQSAVDGNVDFRCTWVSMRDVHATGAEETVSYR
jgi:hypothetical protein